MSVYPRRSAQFRTIAALVVLGTSSACTAGDEQAGSDSSAAATASASDTGAAKDSMAGMNHGAMSNMTPMGGATGDPDRDFLRMMSDHHKGLIAMAHLTIEGQKKGSPGTQADADKLDMKQDAELDSMVTKLEQQYRDPYNPGIMPDNQAMVDQLKTQSGAEYDRTFYQNVIKHHQQAIMMIDHSLPMLKDAQVKAMAERMKRDQTREIQEFERKASGS